MTCIDLEQLSSISLPYKVFASTGKWIVRQNDRRIQFADCQGNVVTEVSLGDIDNHYEFLETPSSLFFVFNGYQVVSIAKKNGSFDVHNLDLTRIGKCVTPISGSDNSLIFGTTSFNRSQIVRYDPGLKKRLCQTASWNLENITDFICSGNIVYSILNNSFIVNADMSTGQTLSTRFESGSIAKKMHLYRQGVLYTVQGVLTYLTKDKSERLQSPQAINAILHVNGNSVYCVSRDMKELLCLDISTNKIVWSVPSQSAIKQCIPAEATLGSEKVNVLVLGLPQSISFVKLSDGTIIRNEKCDNLFEMKITGQNIIVSKSSNGTMVIEGTTNV